MAVISLPNDPYRLIHVGLEIILVVPRKDENDKTGERRIIMPAAPSKQQL
jgi:hypothetical protein